MGILNSLIDDIFVMDAKSELKSKTDHLIENIEVFSAPQAGGGLMGMLGFKQGATHSNQEVTPRLDRERRVIRKKEQTINDEARQKSFSVADFLFGDSNHPNKDNEMEFDEAHFGGQESNKPKSHKSLSYKAWRQEILPSINSNFLHFPLTQEDDLFHFEDVSCTKDVLEMKGFHIYLHNILNWTDEEETFTMEVHYGQLFDGKFRAMHFSEITDNATKSGSQLNFYSNFKYISGTNHILIQLVKTSTQEKLCHSLVDIRGMPRGKFTKHVKAMQVKDIDYKQTPLPQLQFSLFLEPKKENVRDDVSARSEKDTSTFINAFRKLEKGIVNIYRPDKEKNFQKVMVHHLQQDIKQQYASLKQYQTIDQISDIISTKYCFTNIQPKKKFDDKKQKEMFYQFVENCFPEYHNNQVLRALFSQFHDKKDDQPEAQVPFSEFDFKFYLAKYANMKTSSKDEETKEEFFSLRNFLLTVLFQSPITVKEKLDIIYDIMNMSTKFSDGIDTASALNFFNSSLRIHQKFLPFNELSNQMEKTLNGDVCGIVSAFWTKRATEQIKYDTPEVETVSYTDFMRSGGRDAIVDLTKEVQETLQMYHTLYNNKVLDFNDGTVFSDFNRLLMSTGDSNSGLNLINKTAGYRLCLITQVADGERILTELSYNSEGKLEPSTLAGDRNKFVRLFFVQNQNVINLTA